LDGDLDPDGDLEPESDLDDEALDVVLDVGSLAWFGSSAISGMFGLVSSRLSMVSSVSSLLPDADATHFKAVIIKSKRKVKSKNMKFLLQAKKLACLR
jgi:hypothetical protein